MPSGRGLRCGVAFGCFALLAVGAAFHGAVALALGADAGSQPAESDLELTAEFVPPTLALPPHDDAGETAELVVTVRNRGPAEATGVVLAVALEGPAELAASNLDIGSVAVGATVTRPVAWVTVYQPEPVRASVQVQAADQSDPDSSPANDDPGEDDQAEAVVTVTRVLPQASVRGFVWLDADADARFDESEAGLAGIMLRLVDVTTGETARELATDGSGSVVFADLTPGDYRMDVVAPPTGLRLTTTSLSIPVSLSEFAGTQFGFAPRAPPPPPRSQQPPSQSPTLPDTGFDPLIAGLLGAACVTIGGLLLRRGRTAD